MSHLRDRLAALVDGELDHDPRDRVLAHLAACRECRREAEELRAVKSRLAGLPAPPAPAELTLRLLALGASAPPTPAEPPGGPPPGASARPATTRPRATAGPRTVRRTVRPGSRRARTTRFALVGGAVVAAALGTAFAAGGAGSDPLPAPLPAVVPPVDSFAVEHAATASDVPFGDPPGVVAVTVSAPGGGSPR